MILDPGFADPVPDAQRTFRALLDAIARPGTVRRTPALAAPGLPPAMAAIALTLLDASASLWTGPDFADAVPWIAFHTGARPASLAQAAFVLAAAAPDFAALHPGTEDQPEAGATVILAVGALDRGTGFRLTGPGIADAALLHAPLDPGFAAARERAQRYPLGVDVILCAGDALVALPRTTRMEPL